MKRILPALAAASLIVSPVFAESPPSPAAPTKAATEAPAAATATPAAPGALPPPPKITRWEDTGMKPPEAREWQSYGFSPQEGVDWHAAGFEPVVARTWSDKGFDAAEAQAWRDSARHSRSMMAELDHADPAAWKREGFSPADRLAWWEAGFIFEDAVLLSRTGMTPAQAAWHGHEKLKELRGGKSASPDATGPLSSSATASGNHPPPLAIDPASIWRVVGPFMKIGVAGLIAFLAAGFAFFLYHRLQANRKLEERARRHAKAEPGAEPATVPDDDPESEAPPEITPRHSKAMEKRKPARAVKLLTSAKPHCVHCKSTNVRRSKMRPHRFAGINFTEYFRCKNCGRHFAIVSYTAIIAVAAGFVAAVIVVAASFIYVMSIA